MFRPAAFTNVTATLAMAMLSLVAVSCVSRGGDFGLDGNDDDTDTGAKDDTTSAAGGESSGDATATTSEPPEPPAVRCPGDLDCEQIDDVVGVVGDDDAVLLARAGSTDPLGNPRLDGGVYRMTLDGSAYDPVVTGFHEVKGLFASADHVYFTTPDPNADNGRALVQGDRATGLSRVVDTESYFLRDAHESGAGSGWVFWSDSDRTTTAPEHDLEAQVSLGRPWQTYLDDSGHRFIWRGSWSASTVDGAPIVEGVQVTFEPATLSWDGPRWFALREVGPNTTDYEVLSSDKLPFVWTSRQTCSTPKSTLYRTQAHDGHLVVEVARNEETRNLSVVDLDDPDASCVHLATTDRVDEVFSNRGIWDAVDGGVVTVHDGRPEFHPYP